MDTGQAGFDMIWQRVTGQSVPPADETGTMRQIMEAEHRSARYYAALARRLRSFRAQLEALSADEEAHFRAIEVEYYLHCGDTFVPPESCPAPAGPLGSLRSAYHAELEAAETYLRAAEQTSSERLRGIYERNAADERRHADCLRELIARALD